MVFAVTGANGFLGVHIIHHLLQKQHTVLAIKRASGSLNEFNQLKKSNYYAGIVYQNLEWSDCELYDTEGLHVIFKRADYVIHTAGLVSYKKRDLNHLIRINKEYTANVVNMALQAGIKKILYCSSISTLPKQKGQDLITEANMWDNEAAYSNYGLSKYLGECEIYRGIEEGLLGVIVNPGVILGYGDWNKGSNKLFKNAFKAFNFYSLGTTGFVGVEDVARLCYKLCIGDFSNERYILVAENKSYRDVANTMARYFKKKPPSIAVKGIVYRLAYGIFSMAEVLNISGLLTRETVKASITHKRYSHKKVTKDLGYSFQPVEEVIQKATSFYKKSPTKQ